MILLIGIVICAFIVLSGNSKRDEKPVLNKQSGLYIWAKISLIIGIFAYIIMWIKALTK